MCMCHATANIGTALKATADQAGMVDLLQAAAGTVTGIMAETTAGIMTTAGAMMITAAMMTTMDAITKKAQGF